VVKHGWVEAAEPYVWLLIDLYSLYIKVGRVRGQAWFISEDLDNRLRETSDITAFQLVRTYNECKCELQRSFI
jgi:hypothetical protein